MEQADIIGEAFQLARLFPFSAGLRFPEKNFAPGWPESDDRQLGRPWHPPALALVFLAAARIHSEASVPATVRGGISTFLDQLGFMSR